MSITYNYQITKVDQAARVMEVVYTSGGRQTMHIGMRLPFTGESVEAIVQSYAPTRYWEEREAEVIVPTTGASGMVTIPTSVVKPQDIPVIEPHPSVLFPDEYPIAQSFCASKTGGGIEVGYAHSVYNVTEGKRRSRTFDYTHDGRYYYIKVMDNSVTDWYENNVMFKGKLCEWLEYDRQTGTPISYYLLEHTSVIKKFSVATDELLAITYFSPLPVDISRRLTNWPHVSMVFAWAMKEYGDIVEFRETASNDPTLLTGEAPSTLSRIVEAVQLRLDTFARTRNYDGILSASTYAASTVPKFASEGQYCVGVRDTTWNACYAILADVQAETRPMPTLAQIMSELPVLEWPL